MQTNKNIAHYLVAFGVFLLLKYAYRLADTDDLVFLLQPTDKLIGLLTGSHSVYLADNGYFHEQLNIVIDKSCSGFNFWVLSFLLFAYLMLRYFEKPIQKIMSIPFALLGAYFLSLLVNTSRIFVSIIVQSQTKNIFVDQQHLIHEAVGICTNLTFLTLAYVLVEKVFIKKQKNAKFT